MSYSDFEVGDLIVDTDASSAFVGIVIDINPIEMIELRDENGGNLTFKHPSRIYSDTVQMLALGYIYLGIQMSPMTVSFLTDPCCDYKIVVEDMLEDYDRRIRYVLAPIPPPVAPYVQTSGRAMRPSHGPGQAAAHQSVAPAPIPPPVALFDEGFDLNSTVGDSINIDAGEIVPLQGVSFDEEPLTPQCHDDTDYDGDRAMDLVRSMSRGLF